MKDALGRYIGEGNVNPHLDKEIQALNFLTFDEQDDIHAFPGIMDGAIVGKPWAASGASSELDSGQTGNPEGPLGFAFTGQARAGPELVEGRLSPHLNRGASTHGFRELPIISANSRGR
jgi:hypothetical protein